jgi:hypothetical protein
MNARHKALAIALRQAAESFSQEAYWLAGLLERAGKEWGAAATPPPGHRSPSGPERTPEVETMTTEDYTAAVKKLGLDTVRAASALGVSRSQAFRYLRGDSEIPGSVVKLLNLYLRYGSPAGPPAGK